MIVCLDADCTIYFVEQNPVWGPKITARVAALRAGGDEIAVSDLRRPSAPEAARTRISLVAPFTRA